MENSIFKQTYTQVMKQLPYLVATFLLIACGGTEHPPTVDDITITDTLTTDTAVMEAPVIEEVKEQILTLSDFPNQWVMLTPTDSGQVIFNPCDAENPQLQFLEEDGYMYLHEILGQEAEGYTVEEAVQTSTGEMRFSVTSTLSGAHQTIVFNYTNKDQLVGRWSGISHSEYEFVAATNIKTFHAIDQPCKECWGEEGCGEE